MDTQSVSNYSTTKMFWSNVEKILGECIPKCIKEILTSCAYTSLVGLKSISKESVLEIEDHINDYRRDLIQNLSCSHAEFYKSQNKFQMLPGHRDFILSMAKTIVQQESRQCEQSILYEALEKNPNFSVILKELVKTALQNGQRETNNAQYSDIISCFATYLFIMCGKASYTVLCKNLPLPSITKIRKHRRHDRAQNSSIYF